MNLVHYAHHIIGMTICWVWKIGVMGILQVLQKTKIIVFFYPGVVKYFSSRIDNV
jgi:hypothetical protein